MKVKNYKLVKYRKRFKNFNNKSRPRYDKKRNDEKTRKKSKKEPNPQKVRNSN
jgi:hypothetical protein